VVTEVLKVPDRHMVDTVAIGTTGVRRTGNDIDNFFPMVAAGPSAVIGLSTRPATEFHGAASEPQDKENREQVAT